VTYDQIEAFVTIVESGSFIAASEVLHKSQPSLSVAIRKLEEELNLTLFDRSGYRPSLTSQGKHFYERCLKAQKSFKELYSFAKEQSLNIEAELTLALDAAVPLEVLGPFLHQFFDGRHTKLNLELEVLEGSLHKLSQGIVDLAITPLLTHDQPFVFALLARIKMIPVISPALIKNPTMEKLREQPQIIVHNTGPRSNLKYGVEDGKCWYVSDHSLKAYLIQNSLGWGRLPEHLIKDKLTSGALISLEDLGLRATEFEVGLARRKDQVLGPVAKELWNELSLLSLNA
jgi:DNA-binding transcriptional LysR family regulator